MDTIFHNILDISLFSIAVILPLGACAKLLGRRYGVKWRYLLWVVVAVRLVVPISLPEPVEGMRMEVPAPAVSAERLPQARPAGATATEPVIPSGTVASPVQAAALPDAVFPAVSPEPDFPRWISGHMEILWLAGVLVFAAWQGWKYAAFRRMLGRNSRKVRDAAVLDSFYTLCGEMELQKRPALYFCGVLPSPLCMGLFRQAVYINSEDREPEDMRLILKHELTHCKRGDLWFKALLLLARALHFFNPLVHWMARLAARDMEYSCDQSVMRDCTLEERQAYSMAILRTVREGRQADAALTTAFSGGKKELKTRFENIFDMGAKKRGIALFMAAALAACCGTAFVGCQRERDTALYGDYTEEIVAEMYREMGASIMEEAKENDVPPVLRLLGLMPMPKGVSYEMDGFTSYTVKEPYYVRFQVNWKDTPETVYTFEGERYVDDRWNRIHAMLFLALVDDLDEVQFSFAEEGGSRVQSFSREDMERYFGTTDLRSFAADEETFRAFVQAVNQYFYDSIDRPEEIKQLANLDDASAQSRMALSLQEAGAGVIYGDYTAARVQKLFGAKLKYVGDAVGVGRIFGLLPHPDGVAFGEEGQELFTDVLPYGARRYLEWTETPETVWTDSAGETVVDDRWCTIHALIFFALVDNADYFNYTWTAADPETGERKEVQWACTRDELQRRYYGEDGDADVWGFTNNIENFQKFVLALNRYFYEGIDTPQKIGGLLALDDAAAQERMDWMLYDNTSGKSESAKTWQIDVLLWDIMHQDGETMLSSNPQIYTDCKEYRELVWLGESTLKYCLAAFARGENLDTLEGYIMMYACQDILGQERSPGQTPGEWYMLYSAVDSIFCVPFVYDEAVYTEDLAQYAFDEHVYEPPDTGKWSILDAGKDARVRAVYDAVSARFQNDAGGIGRSTVIFAPSIYKMTEQGDSLSVYMRLDWNHYALVHMPQGGYTFLPSVGGLAYLRLDFEKKGGEWTLDSWTEAETGTGMDERFEESVQELCAGEPEVAKQMIDGGRNGKPLLQNVVYYMKANYGGMDIPVEDISSSRGGDLVAKALEENR